MPLLLVVAVDPATHRAYDADNVHGAPSAAPRVVNLDELSPGLLIKAFTNGEDTCSPDSVFRSTMLWLCTLVYFVLMQIL